jgi:hypothetical protein
MRMLALLAVLLGVGYPLVAWGVFPLLHSG